MTKVTAFYNEINHEAAEHLRGLIAAGQIAPGVVDERSIEDVCPDELAGFTQCHFFAGIGIWSLALRAAGVPDDTRLWTGSCPCQPFSAAGKGAGMDDERHLWPAWFHLISQRRPVQIFGEQVASKDTGPWIDLVHDDLEALGYAVGAVPFPAAGIGAPNIRDRLYWAASAGVTLGDTGSKGLEGYGWHGDHGHQSGRVGAIEARPVTAAGGAGGLACTDEGERRRRTNHEPVQCAGDAAGRYESSGDAERSGRVCELANPTSDGHQGWERQDREPITGGIGESRLHPSGAVEDGRLAHAGSERHDGSGAAGTAGTAVSRRLDASGCSAPSVGMADADGGHASAERQQRSGQQRQQPQDDGTGYMADTQGGGCREECPDAGGSLVGSRAQGLPARPEHGGGADRPGPVNGYWAASDWLHCRDGKWRPVEPGTFPLAHGLPRSLGALSPELQRLAEVAGLSRASLKGAKAYRIDGLKGYGNAINAIAAQAFIESSFEALATINALGKAA